MRLWAKAIEKVLREHPATRDSDPLLYETVIREIGFTPDSWLAKDLIDAVADRKIPSWDRVTRARRFLQEMHPDLRGRRFVERHRKAGEFRYAVEDHALSDDDLDPH